MKKISQLERFVRTFFCHKMLEQSYFLTITKDEFIEQSTDSGKLDS